jgi:hypothetical protein
LKANQIKAMKSNDLTEEDEIEREIWDYTIERMTKRKDILRLTLPKAMYEVYTEHLPAIKEYISQMLADKINEVIQKNLFFLIENNFGDIRVIDELFGSVGSKLSSRSNSGKIVKIFVGFIDS